MAVFTFSPAGAQWVSIDFVESGREFVSTIFESYRETFNSNQIKLYFGDATMTFAGRGLAFTTYMGELADVTAGTMTGLFVDSSGGHRVFSLTGLSISAAALFDQVEAGNSVQAFNMLLAGHDQITGGSGNDRLYGHTGNDVLRGAGGRDILLGDVGNDDLFGGVGNDVLTGGRGQDDFVFNTAPSGSTNFDRITDFSAVDDRILLENAVFTRLAAGGLAASQFVLGTQAQDANDRIIYQRATGTLWYDRDGTGAAAKVAFADLADGTALTAADFLVI